MKYGYDKKLLKSLGVGPFLGQVKLLASPWSSTLEITAYWT